MTPGSRKFGYGEGSIWGMVIFYGDRGVVENSYFGAW